MARGRIPSTKFKKKEISFYPLHRCKLCPRKWKGTERDKSGEVVRIMSCKDTCFYIGRV